jgi:hypothetical protein
MYTAARPRQETRRRTDIQGRACDSLGNTLYSSQQCEDSSQSRDPDPDPAAIPKRGELSHALQCAETVKQRGVHVPRRGTVVEGSLREKYSCIATPGFPTGGAGYPFPDRRAMKTLWGMTLGYTGTSRMHRG